MTSRYTYHTYPTVRLWDPVTGEWRPPSTPEELANNARINEELRASMFADARLCGKLLPNFMTIHCTQTLGHLGSCSA